MLPEGSAGPDLLRLLLLLLGPPLLLLGVLLLRLGHRDRLLAGFQPLDELVVPLLGDLEV